MTSTLDRHFTRRRLARLGATAHLKQPTLTPRITSIMTTSPVLPVSVSIEVAKDGWELDSFARHSSMAV